MSLIIPPTSRQCYISLMVALNIHSPNGTGDWHSAATFAKPMPLHLYVCGDNQPYNTNPLLGSAGVINGTQRLKRMGIVSEHTPVFIADHPDHPRACFDLLYVMVLQQGAIRSVILDDWFPCFADKQAVYALIWQAEPHLRSQQQERLALWKQRNPLSRD